MTALVMNKYRVEITHEGSETKVYLMEDKRVIDVDIFKSLTPSKELVVEAVRKMIKLTELRSNSSAYIADLERNINRELKSE